MTAVTRCRVGTTQGLHNIGSQEGVAFPGEAVRALAYDDETWWALVGEGETWRHKEGDDWIRVADPPNEPARCLLPVAAEPLIGTDESHIYRVKHGRLQKLKTFENAPSRERWFTPWGGPPAVRSMAAAPDGALYVNVHVGGIMRSDDGGASWRQTIDIKADVHQVHYDEGSGLLLAAAARGLAVSEDRGDNWAFHRGGLHGSYSRAVAVADEFLLASASTGAHTSRAALYRKPLLSDGPFERCTQGLPEWFPDNINTNCLAAMGDTLAFGTDSGQVFVSEDQGASWRMLTEDLPPVRCLALG